MGGVFIDFEIVWEGVEIELDMRGLCGAAVTVVREISVIIQLLLMCVCVCFATMKYLNH